MHTSNETADDTREERQVALTSHHMVQRGLETLARLEAEVSRLQKENNDLRIEHKEFQLTLQNASTTIARLEADRQAAIAEREACRTEVVALRTLFGTFKRDLDGFEVPFGPAQGKRVVHGSGYPRQAKPGDTISDGETVTYTPPARTYDEEGSPT